MANERCRRFCSEVKFPRNVRYYYEVRNNAVAVPNSNYDCRVVPKRAPFSHSIQRENDHGRRYTAAYGTNYHPFHIGHEHVGGMQNSTGYGCVPRIRRQKHYYTSQRLFEQSLDVYWPKYDFREDLVVLLTVGSGWMGHPPWVYRGTSWWNSLGPKTIASALHCKCVCIRHRGAYVQLPDWFTLLGYCLLLPVGIIAGALLWYNNDQLHQTALLVSLALLSI